MCSYPGNRFARALNGVPRSALFLLLDELHAGSSHRLPHALRLVADDRVDILVLRQAAGGRDHMAQQRLAADLVKHLRPARLQPRALAGGHDYDRQLRCGLLRLARFLAHSCPSAPPLLLSWRSGNRDVDGVHRPHLQFIQSGLDLRAIANHQHGVLVGMNILLRSGIQIGDGHLLQRCLVGLKVVRRIAVELQPHPLRKHLVLGVIPEQERIQNVVLGALQFFLGERLRRQSVQSPCRFAESRPRLSRFASAPRPEMLPDDPSRTPALRPPRTQAQAACGLSGTACSQTRPQRRRSSSQRWEHRDCAGRFPAPRSPRCDWFTSSLLMK